MPGTMAGEIGTRADFRAASASASARTLEPTGSTLESSLAFAGFPDGAGDSDACEYRVLADGRGGFYLVPSADTSLGGGSPLAGSRSFPALRAPARFVRPLADRGTVRLSASALGELGRRIASVAAGRVSPEFRIAGPGAYRKITIAVTEPASGTQIFAKLPAHPGGVEPVKREATVLRELAQIPELNGSVPQVLSMTDWRGVPLLALSSGPSRTGPRGFGRTTRQFLTRLHETTVSVESFADCGACVRWSGTLATLAARSGPSAASDVLTQAADRIGSVLAGVSLPVSTAHGDFTRSNTRRGPEGLFVFDWEAARAQTLPGFDAFHLRALPRLVRGGPVRRPAVVVRWLEQIWPESPRYAEVLWLAFLVEVGLHYAYARALYPQEGDDRVVVAAVREIRRSLENGRI